MSANLTQPAKLLLLVALLSKDRIISNNGKAFIKDLILRRDPRLNELIEKFELKDSNDMSFLELIHNLISDEAKVLYNELFVDTSVEIGKALSKSEREKKNLNEEKSLIYGEVEFDSFYRVLRKINPAPGLTFYDLGSGTGKAIFVARMVQDFAKCIGVEILTSLHKQASVIVNRFNEEFRDHLALGQSQYVNVYEGSFLDFDWSDGDVVFANSTCFSDELMISLSQQAECLKPGAIVVTFTKGMTSKQFELLERKRYRMSWGPATVFIHRKLNANGNSIGPVKLNILPSDAVTYYEEDPPASHSAYNTASNDADDDEDEEEEDDVDVDYADVYNARHHANGGTAAASHLYYSKYGTKVTEEDDSDEDDDEEEEEEEEDEEDYEGSDEEEDGEERIPNEAEEDSSEDDNDDADDDDADDDTDSNEDDDDNDSNEDDEEEDSEEDIASDDDDEEEEEQEDEEDEEGEGLPVPKVSYATSVFPTTSPLRTTTSTTYISPQRLSTNNALNNSYNYSLNSSSSSHNKKPTATTPTNSTFSPTKLTSSLHINPSLSPNPNTGSNSNSNSNNSAKTTPAKIYPIMNPGLSPSASTSSSGNYVDAQSEFSMLNSPLDTALLMRKRAVGHPHTSNNNNNNSNSNNMPSPSAFSFANTLEEDGEEN